MSVLAFCEWLASTEGSIRLHESLYMCPTVESLHVWASTLFIGMTALLDFRLVGIALGQIPVSEVARRLLPLALGGFIVRVLSGILLCYAIPVHTYHSVFFRAKLLLLILAGVNAWTFHARVWRRVADWDHEVKTPPSARTAGWLSLVLWILIAAARFLGDAADSEWPRQVLLTTSLLFR